MNSRGSNARRRPGDRGSVTTTGAGGVWLSDTSQTDRDADRDNGSSGNTSHSNDAPADAGSSSSSCD